MLSNDTLILHRIAYPTTTKRLYFNMVGRLIAVAESRDDFYQLTNYYCLEGVWESSHNTQIVSQAELDEMGRE